jgi:hypothetical protein
MLQIGIDVDDWKVCSKRLTIFLLVDKRGHRGGLQINFKGSRRFRPVGWPQALKKRKLRTYPRQPNEPCEQTANLNYNREGAMLQAHEALKAANTAAIRECRQ